jgi:small subunit ribosomal protein S7e
MTGCHVDDDFCALGVYLNGGQLKWPLNAASLYACFRVTTGVLWAAVEARSQYIRSPVPRLFAFYILHNGRLQRRFILCARSSTWHFPLLQAARSKIVKKDGAAPTAIETRVAAELAAIEANNAALKNDLRTLYISAAREIEIDGGRKAIVVVVPFPLLADFKKIQKALIEELEKKLSVSAGSIVWAAARLAGSIRWCHFAFRFQGNTVLIIANRTLVSGKTWQRSEKFTGVRPRSRTLQQVQSALLDDLCFPSEITGKRLRVRADGGRVLKVHLSQKDQHAVADRTDVFRAVYKKLTSKDVTFEFDPATGRSATA